MRDAANSGGWIGWVEGSCRLLQATAEEFRRSQPFKDLTIGTAIHLEPKTAALLLTLQAGGATVRATGNLNSTQPETVAYLRERGIDVIGEPTSDAARHAGFLDALLAQTPDLLLDNGGDLFARVVERPYARLLGGTEETTSGRARLVPLRDRIRRPVLVINDSPLKQFAENRHAVGQSVFESFLRCTNRSTNGKHVTVFGYGACGKGVAACFRNAYAQVTVVDTNPVATLEAHFDGFATPVRERAISSADIVITVTGAPNVLTAADLPLFKEGAILLNAGHFPWEIAVEAIEANDAIEARYDVGGTITTWQLRDGRRLHLLGHGHMLNLAGPRPLGNSIESMDLGFTLQARCLEAIARGNVAADSCVVPVPAAIDAAVASTYLALARGT